MRLLKLSFSLLCVGLFVYQNVEFLFAYKKYPTARSGAFQVNRFKWSTYYVMESWLINIQCFPLFLELDRHWFPADNIVPWGRQRLWQIQNWWSGISRLCQVHVWWSSQQLGEWLDCSEYVTKSPFWTPLQSTFHRGHPEPNLILEVKWLYQRRIELDWDSDGSSWGPMSQTKLYTD